MRTPQDNFDLEHDLEYEREDDLDRPDDMEVDWENKSSREVEIW